MNVPESGTAKGRFESLVKLESEAIEKRTSPLHQALTESSGVPFFMPRGGTPMTAHNVPNITDDVVTAYAAVIPETRLSLSKAEAAAAVGVSVKTIDRWIHGGDLIAHKISNRTVRIMLDDLIAAHRIIPSTGAIKAGLV